MFKETIGVCGLSLIFLHLLAIAEVLLMSNSFTDFKISPGVKYENCGYSYMIFFKRALLTSFQKIVKEYQEEANRKYKWCCVHATNIFSRRLCPRF